MYAWSLVAAAIAGIWLGSVGKEPPALTTILFWTALVVAVEVLPVSLDLESQVTMSFPIHLAVAMIFDPWAGMIIAGVGSLDPRELKREITLHHAFFNRAQVAISVGVAAVFFTPFHGELDTLRGLEAGLLVAIVGAAFLYTATNLGLVAVWISLRQRVSVWTAIKSLPPDPPLGFWISHVLLAGLGVATAIVYSTTEYGAWAVGAFIIPLLFARLSILGARSAQQLTEQLQKQQAALLDATEQVFQEREAERHRIAEHIHDSSLQLLAATRYGFEVAKELLVEDRADEVHSTLQNAEDSLDEAIKVLRTSLVDLRESTIRAGGLMETIRDYANQVSTLWGVTVTIEGWLSREPPVSVALGAFQIVQEAVNNALKHADSPDITVRINNETDGIRIVVEDYGAGFDSTVATAEDHMGIRLMKERAVKLNGSVEVVSELGRGTKIQAVLPGVVGR